MNEEGQFEISIITNLHGFPISSSASGDRDPEKQSAVVALIERTGLQVRDQLGMSATDEISVYDTHGNRLVCRPFEANGQQLILAVLVSDKNKSYRRLTNKTISAIRRSWKL